MTAGDIDRVRPANAVAAADAAAQVRDIADVPAVEIITTAAVHLMSAAAVAVGLADGMGDHPGDGPEGDGQAVGSPDPAGAYADLAEARILITALAGLVSAAGPDLGPVHARSLRDGLRSLQLAFREASVVADPPGAGPGETWTGPVSPVGQARYLPPSAPAPR